MKIILKLRRVLSVLSSLWISLLFLSVGCSSPSTHPSKEYDVIVYGGTSGGVIAAIEVSDRGRSVLLIEPSQHLGGLSSGGLGQTDIGNKAAIGGKSREFYKRIADYYQKESAWRFQKKEEYRSIGQSKTNEGELTLWTFEPHVAERVYDAWIQESKVDLLKNERLDRSKKLSLVDGNIREITLESGKKFRGKVFIDATYEGDLLALAGVSYTVGREANATHGETLNGVQVANSVHHQFRPKVDPYVEIGNPASGLLPGIDPQGPGEEGGEDHRVQAYCFRMCLTDHPDNRQPFKKPDGYDPKEYELLLRNFEAGETAVPWHHGLMPNRKTDTNNNKGVSTDYIGQNYRWPEASYEEREEIYKRHLVYQKGLLWTLANHPRVPQKIRDEVSRWGTSKDEFVDNDGWSHQIYVREARRMVSSYVMSQQDCQGGRVAEDPVGLAAYTMDSHNVQRYLSKEGFVRNEGDVQVGGFSPYPISYRSIIPKSEECKNLLVPVCLSASHIAFGSIRMEPVFMVLGQSAAIAAAISIDEGISVQEVNYSNLKTELLQAGQVLKWEGPQRKIGLDPKKLKGQVIDDHQAKKVGAWVNSRSNPKFVGTSYLHDNNEGKGEKSVEFSFTPKENGKFKIGMSYTSYSNRASNVPVQISYEGAPKLIKVNQRVAIQAGKPFYELAVYDLEAGKPVTVTISNSGTDGYVIVDAIQCLRM